MTGGRRSSAAVATMDETVPHSDAVQWLRLAKLTLSVLVLALTVWRALGL